MNFNSFVMVCYYRMSKVTCFLYLSFIAAQRFGYCYSIFGDVCAVGNSCDLSQEENISPLWSMFVSSWFIFAPVTISII